MEAIIESIKGLEILDSRGRPTVLAKCKLQGGFEAMASVPSGASTGKAEAVELRDGDQGRYGGLGCKKAVSNIHDIIQTTVVGRNFVDQKAFDECLIDLDGTENKSRLGANAILACSIAYAKAKALSNNLQLFEYFGSLISNQTFRLPRITVNLFSGGKHAGGQIPVQDLLVVPVSAEGIEQSLADVYSVYQSAARLVKKKYGMRSLTADEGGLAPEFTDVYQMLDDAMQSIKEANLNPGADVALAMDVAASHFFQKDHYLIGDAQLTSVDQVKLVRDWVAKYPIVSVEDGLAEDDWEYWPQLHEQLREKALVLGDDLLCTQVKRIQKAMDTRSANALLLKVNQCGTLTEAAAAFQLAKSAGWQVTVSARSGETEDNWLADLAVGWGGDQIKIGSITQSERLAKYNRLLEIEEEYKFEMNSWPK